MKLYGAGASRWVKPYWLLKELGLAFEPVTVKLSTGEHCGPDYVRINPFAKVPALADDSLTLYESAAICNYIAEKRPEAGLLPRGRDRAVYDQWISFITTELEQPLWRMVKHRFIYPEERRIPADIELATLDFHKLCTTLELLLPEGYLVAGRFTVADITMAYTLKWATLPSLPPDLLAPFPRLRAYLERQTGRAAFPRDLYPQPKAAAPTS